MSKKVYC